MEVAFGAFGDHIFPPGPNLFDCGVVEEHPFGGLGVEGEGTIVATGVTDHPNQLKLSLFGMLVCHPVEELQTHTLKITLFGQILPKTLPPCP